MENERDTYGTWHETNGQKYLELKAPDHYTLGKLEAKFLWPKIWLFKLIIMLFSLLFLWRGMTYWKMRKIARQSEPPLKACAETLPAYAELIKEMEGIADHIFGITYDDILLQNYFIELMYGYLIPRKRYNVPEGFNFGCTAVGGFNKDGRPLIGQTFDFNPLMRCLSCFVLHRVADKPQVFSFRMGAMLSLPAAKTENGLSMAVTVVKTRFPTLPIIGTGIRTRYGLENLETPEQMVQMMNTMPDSIGYNLLISSERTNSLFAGQLTPKGIRWKRIKKHVALSNTFNAPELQEYLYDKKYSKKRQALAEELIEKAYKDGFSEEKLMSILSNRSKICKIKTTSFITPNRFGIGRPCKQSHGKYSIQVRKNRSF